MNGPLSLPSPTDPFTLFLVAALVFSRGLDFLSTWIVTPHLELEANPFMRRRRWRTMMLTILTKSFRTSGWRYGLPT